MPKSTVCELNPKYWVGQRHVEDSETAKRASGPDGSSVHHYRDGWILHPTGVYGTAPKPEKTSPSKRKGDSNDFVPKYSLAHELKILCHFCATEDK